MARAETSARNYDPGLMQGIPIWLKHLDPTGATNQQVVTFDGTLGEWVNGWGGALFGQTSGLISNPTITPTSNETFYGYQAGLNATTNNLIAIGINAGNGATNADYGIFIGTEAGQGALNATQSMFLGYRAGYQAIDASYATFYGQEAGSGAVNGYNSMFAGFRAGKNAVNASNSVFFGYLAGENDTVDNSGSSSDFSILIGPSTSTGGFSRSVAIGYQAVNTAEDQVFFASNFTDFHLGLNAYDDDTAAGLAGLVAGDWYQTTGMAAAPLNVAGIVMIKQ